MTGKATIDSTLGALEIGLIISAMFYGVTCVQVYHCAHREKIEHPIIKATVAAIWVLETLHMTLLIKWFYGISVTNFGKPESYTDLNWTYCTAIIFHGLVGTVVQWFFSWRVWSVSKRAYLAIPPAIVSVIRCCLAFFIAAKFGTIGEKGFHDHYRWAFIVAQALNTATDVWNAVALVLFLRTRRSAYKNTNDMLNRIMLFTLETGMVTAGLALTLCLTWAVMPYNEIWNGILFVYTRSNANAVLVALNSRNTNQEAGSSNVYSASTGSQSIGMGNISYTRGGGSEVQSPKVKQGVFIETETVLDKEYPL